MAKISKRALKWIGASLGVAVVAFLGVRYLIKRHNALPEGIVSGNGRIEAKLVDVAAKEPLRVKEVLVDEGALVKPGQVLVRLDTVTLQSQLAGAKASIDAAEEKLAVGQRQHRQGEERDQPRRDRGGALPATRRGWRRLAAGARRPQGKAGDDAGPPSPRRRRRSQTARQEVEVARANAATIQTRIDDATLKSPVTGRVLYRLAEPGEVLAPGGKALTLVNLRRRLHGDLPPLGAGGEREGRRRRADHRRLRRRSAPWPGTSASSRRRRSSRPSRSRRKSEREKLMFRVKIQLPKEVASQYVERIKTGVRGVGYVKVKDTAVWPERLQNLVPTATTVGLGE